MSADVFRRPKKGFELPIGQWLIGPLAETVRRAIDPARLKAQGLFRPEDNLESPYARDALRQLYRRIYRGDVAGCSLGAFEDATGLSLTDDNGLKDDLPPITTFLNRLLALTIDMQAVRFSAFEGLLDQRIEGAIARERVLVHIDDAHDERAISRKGQDSGSSQKLGLDRHGSASKRKAGSFKK